MKNEYRVENGLIYIKIFRKGIEYETTVNETHLERLIQLDVNWFGLINSKKTKNIYAVATTKNTSNKIITIYLHRFVTNCPARNVVDHKNGKTLENVDDNLNVVTYRENSQNKHKVQSNSLSGFTGVRWDEKANKWRSTINVDKKKIYLGVYENLEDAKEVRLMAEDKYFDYKKELGNIESHKTFTKEELSELRIRSDNNSGCEGVNWNIRNQKWHARIKVLNSNKRIHLGYFISLEDAIKARKLAEESYF